MRVKIHYHHPQLCYCHHYIDYHQLVHYDNRNTDDAIFENSTSEKPRDGHQNPPPVPAQESGSKLALEMVSQTVLILHNESKKVITDDVIHRHKPSKISMDSHQPPLPIPAQKSKPEGSTYILSESVKIRY